MKTTQIGNIRYRINLLDRFRQRKSTDLCPICKNGMACEKMFAHGRYWT